MLLNLYLLKSLYKEHLENEKGALIQMDILIVFGNAELIDVIDTIVPVSVLKELITSNKRGYLYGKNAGPNPYPPHSYQGSMWVKSQTYYVIGG